MHTFMVTVLGIALAGFAAQALAAPPKSYPEGQGWSAIEADFDNLETQADTLQSTVEEVGAAVNNVQSTVEGVGAAVDEVLDAIDGRVEVEVEATSVFAVAGGDGQALAVVRVEQMNGGVSGLTVDDFSLPSTGQIVPPGGSAMAIDVVSATGAPGTYVVHLIPLFTWLQGTYIATIVVDTGAGSDGALVKVVVPPAP